MTIWWGKRAPEHADEGDFWIEEGPDVTVAIASNDAAQPFDVEHFRQDLHELVVFLQAFQAVQTRRAPTRAPAESSDAPSPLQEE